MSDLNLICDYPSLYDEIKEGHSFVGCDTGLVLPGKSTIHTISISSKTEMEVILYLEITSTDYLKLDIFNILPIIDEDIIDRAMILHTLDERYDGSDISGVLMKLHENAQILDKHHNFSGVSTKQKILEIPMKVNQDSSYQITLKSRSHCPVMYGIRVRVFAYYDD